MLLLKDLSNFLRMKNLKMQIVKESVKTHAIESREVLAGSSQPVAEPHTWPPQNFNKLFYSIYISYILKNIVCKN